MTHKFFLTLSVIALGGCSSMMDHQTDVVTFKTPGAENAKCLIENEDIKYIAYTDQTLEMMKSPHDLVVRCMAPGNREQTVVVKREVNGWIVANVANGFIPGTAYDYFSRGAFNYPDTITVSFVGDPVKPYPLPAYQSTDLRDNNEANGRIEYMGPGIKMTEETRHQQPVVLEKRESQYGVSDFAGMMGGEPVAAKKAAPLDNLHRQYNPGVAYDPSEEDK